jgi:hypothetical protein
MNNGTGSRMMPAGGGDENPDPVGTQLTVGSQPMNPGDTVIWWKRIPGGEYVYPVKATVLALTPKRVKIEADDEGQTVIRYVPVQSLQRHDG